MFQPETKITADIIDLGLIFLGQLKEIRKGNNIYF